MQDQAAAAELRAKQAAEAEMELVSRISQLEFDKERLLDNLKALERV